MMTDPFHEAKEALSVAKREYAAVSSLSVMAANAANQACENAVRTLCQIAIGSPLPHQDFKPYHKPAAYVLRIGIESEYSEKMQAFLGKLNGFALDDARYESTQAYKEHTKSSAQQRGKELIEGTERFLLETIDLSKKEEVLSIIRVHWSNKDRAKRPP